VKVVKPEEPVKVVKPEEPSIEIDTKTFKSSISSADDNITEVIIQDKEESELTTLHMLLLVLLLVSIVGLLIILSRKKRKASLLFEENVDESSNIKMNQVVEVNEPSVSLKPTDRYIAAMKYTNKE